MKPSDYPKAIIQRWDDRHFIVMYEFKFYDYEFTVPQGFITDLASIPKVLWWLYPPYGDYMEAAIYHDYLYALGIGKSFADKCFKQLMLNYGVSKFTAEIFYQSVKLFGNPENSVKEFKRRGLAQVSGEWK